MLLNNVRKLGKLYSNIKGIGISYQMHGLVMVNEKQELLGNAIIWCDSRATQLS